MLICHPGRFFQPFVVAAVFVFLCSWVAPSSSSPRQLRVPTSSAITSLSSDPFLQAVREVADALKPPRVRSFLPHANLAKQDLSPTRIGVTEESESTHSSVRHLVEQQQSESEIRTPKDVDSQWVKVLHAHPLLHNYSATDFEAHLDGRLIDVRYQLQAWQSRLPPTRFFLHMPKTGGTGFANVLASHERGGFFQAWHYVHGPVVEQLRAAHTIHGHLRYGAHKYLEPGSPHCYLLMFRHPLERTLSNYYYHLREPLDAGHRTALRAGNLTNWLQISDMANNIYTQFLLGSGAPYNAGEVESYLPARPAPNQPRPPFVLTEAHYRIARHRLLTQVGFVGLLEEYDSTLVLLADRLDWRTDPVPRPALAKTTKHRGLDHVTAEELHALKRANRWDLKLYRLAVTIFEQQVRWFGGRSRLQQLLSSGHDRKSS